MYCLSVGGVPGCSSRCNGLRAGKRGQFHAGACRRGSPPATVTRDGPGLLRSPSARSQSGVYWSL